MKRIVLTGGGTAGHVIPNIALIPYLKENGFDISYIGTKDGIEHNLISEYKDIEYYSIKSGKLRRYLDVKNLSDPFRVLYAIGQSANIIRTLKPEILFSKGGFVSVPVVIGAWLNSVPIIIHESDLTPGLANRIATKFAKKVCTTFPDTVSLFKDEKAIHTGTPIRKELLEGSKALGFNICNFNNKKPVILIMGGSLGAVSINRAIRSILNRLTAKFQVIHICGRGNVDNGFKSYPGYVQFEYVGEELAHLMAICDIVISRAGANAIYEFLALKKPSLLIPLPLSASRGDQLDNAKSFEKQGFSKVLFQEDMTDETLYSSILELYENRHVFIDNMKDHNMESSIDIILKLIEKHKK